MADMPADYLQADLASRWALEPVYPEVTAQDADKCALLAQYLAAHPGATHHLLGVTVGLDALPPYLGYLVINDAYEHGDLALIRQYITTADTALVLGGGMGVTGVALAQQTGKPVTVVDANAALEPRIALQAQLNKVALAFRHGAVVPGRRDGTVTFVISDEFWASSLRQDTYKASHTVTVPVLDLRAVLEQVTANCLFVDIEGAEEGLFTPGLLPAHINKLFVEVHRPALGGARWAKVLNDIAALGFRLCDGSGLTHYWVRGD